MLKKNPFSIIFHVLRFRSTEKYLDSIGQTIFEFSKVIPDGLLVFFPSYPVMRKCTEHWIKQGIWQAINDQKRIFIEPQVKEEFKSVMKNYYDEIKDMNSSGAIFMAVMRGKVSEGLDFADMYGRAVIITGIPFAPYKDPKIVFKKQYLDENRTPENQMSSGQEWYTLDAIKAINQAIGRVIRHKDDYGAILFCDTRFNRTDIRKYLSDWIKKHMNDSTQDGDFDQILVDMQQFYQIAEQQVNDELNCMIYRI